MNATAGAPQVGEVLPALDLAGFTAAEVAHYAAASGDDNPVHTDLAVAHAAGLPALVVHGMLLVGQLEGAIRRWRADATIVALSARFIRPVFVSQPLVIRSRVVARDAAHAAHFIVRQVLHGDQDRPVCVADTHVAIGVAAIGR